MRVLRTDYSIEEKPESFHRSNSPNTSISAAVLQKMGGKELSNSFEVLNILLYLALDSLNSSLHLFDMFLYLSFPTFSSFISSLL